jgi:hypothetical protein
MMKLFFPTCLFLSLLALNSLAQPVFTNRSADLHAYVANARNADAIRKSRHLTEDQFLQAMAEPGVVLLDTRNAAAYKLRHVKDAVNLSLPDLSAASVAPLVPAKSTKVLVYGSNNFPEAASPAPAASPKISAFVNLYTYGYTNIFELGPVVDVKTTKLPLAGGGSGN